MIHKVRILYRLKTNCDREIEKILQPLKMVNTLFHEFFRHKLKFRDFFVVVVVRTGSYSIECCSNSVIGVLMLRNSDILMQAVSSFSLPKLSFNVTLSIIFRFTRYLFPNCCDLYFLVSYLCQQIFSK